MENRYPSTSSGRTIFFEHTFCTITKGLNETGIESLRQDTQSVALKHGWITAH